MTDFIICRARSVSPLTADSPVCSLPQILEQPVIQVVTFTWNSQLYFLPESGTVSYPDIHSGAAVIWVIFTWNSQSLGIIPGAASNPVIGMRKMTSRGLGVASGSRPINAH